MNAVPAAPAADPEAQDRRRLRTAVLAAAGFHLLLFGLPAPSPEAVAAPPAERPLVVVRPVRFQPPEEPPERPPERREVRVPVPDPTPDDPEPLRPLDLPAVEKEAWDGALIVDVPDGPPPRIEAPEVYQVGGRIAPPRPLEQPPPRYSEAARRARIQGPVVLALILGEDGRVASLEVVRGLPFGLSDAAAEAVARWRYEPATLGGRPVKVRMTVTVNFELS